MYYSQVGQDQWVEENIFKGLKEGVFVDVGAHDGKTFSNSLYFEEQHNWQGICIEPNPLVFPQLAACRRAYCVNTGLGDKNDSLEFWKVNGYSEMLSGFGEFYNDEHIERIHREIDQYGGSLEKLSIPVQTLSHLLKQYNFSKIDLLSIDVEGAELAVLKGIDFDKTSISVIVAECNYEDEKLAVREYLEAKNYKYVKFISTDLVFVSKDSSYIDLFDV